MIPNEILIVLMFVGLLVGLIALGAHLGFMLAMIAIIAGFIGWEGTGFLTIFPVRIWQIMTNYVLVAIPLFVFMGYMLERSGFAESLFLGVDTILPLRGGMAVLTIIICTILAATTGIVATGVIMAGVIALPSMLRAGYNKGLALGSVAASGTLGILIPPSIMLVFYASLSGLSVGHLFLAAFGPGFLLSALFIGYVLLIAAIRPKWAPRLGEVPEVELPGIPKRQIRPQKPLWLRGIISTLPVAVLIVAVLGTIVFGIATPTEASACGAAGAIAIVAIYRKLNLEVLKDACLRTVATMGMFGGIIIGGMGFAGVFAGLGGRQIIYNLLVGMETAPIVVLFVILGIVVILGMFIDYVAILLILIGTIIPIQNSMGWDPLWFGMLVCITLQTAWLTPPFGYSLFFLRGLNIPGVTFNDIVKGCVPFIFLQMAGVLLCVFFPEIITGLPSLLFR